MQRSRLIIGTSIVVALALALALFFLLRPGPADPPSAQVSPTAHESERIVAGATHSPSASPSTEPKESASPTTPLKDDEPKKPGRPRTLKDVDTKDAEDVGLFFAEQYFNKNVSIDDMLSDTVKDDFTYLEPLFEVTVRTADRDQIVTDEYTNYTAEASAIQPDIAGDVVDVRIGATNSAGKTVEFGTLHMLRPIAHLPDKTIYPWWIEFIDLSPDFTADGANPISRDDLVKIIDSGGYAVEKIYFWKKDEDPKKRAERINAGFSKPGAANKIKVPLSAGGYYAMTPYISAEEFQLGRKAEDDTHIAYLYTNSWQDFGDSRCEGKIDIRIVFELNEEGTWVPMDVTAKDRVDKEHPDGRAIKCIREGDTAPPPA